MIAWLFKILGAIVTKSKSTTAKVGGSIVGAGGALTLILALHADIKAEINQKLQLTQETTTAKVETIKERVKAHEQQTSTKFQAVQQTIDLQVQSVGQQMKAIEKGQMQTLKMLEKLDQRLYQLKQQNGG